MIFVVPPVVIFCIAMMMLNHGTTLEERQARGSMVGQGVLVLVIIYIAWVVIAGSIMLVGGGVYYLFFSGPLELVKYPPAVVYYEEGERVVLQVEAKGGEDYDHQWKWLHIDELEELEAEYGSIEDAPYTALPHGPRHNIVGSYNDIPHLEFVEDGPSGTGVYYKGKKVGLGSFTDPYPVEDHVAFCVIDELGWHETNTPAIRFKAKERKDE